MEAVTVPVTHVIDLIDRSRREWWARIAFGAFWIAFCLIAAAMLATGNARAGRGGPPGTPADALAPLAWSLIGFGIVGYRQRRELDVREQCLRTQAGWLVLMTPIRRTPVAIGAWHSVTVGPSGLRRVGKTRRYVHPVSLDGAGGSAELSAPHSEVTALRIGERIAMAARLPLIDRTIGIASPAADGVGDRSRAVRGTDADVASMPSVAMRVEEAMHGIRVRVPTPSHERWAIAAVVAFLTGFVLFGVWLRGHGMGGEAYIPAVCLSVACTPMIIRGLRIGIRTATITIRPDALIVRGRRIAAERVDRIDVVVRGRSRWLRLITADEDVRFGEDLGGEDLAWLRATITRALRGLNSP